MKLTNVEIDMYVTQLTQLAPKTTGKLGYAIAKNLRVLNNELVEYRKIKDDTIKQFGELSESGYYQIKTDSPAFSEFVKEMKQYDDIISDVNLIMVNPEDIYNSQLNGEETMQLLFMINDEEE